MKGFLAFAVCFALLMQIWYGHYLFFRRYGLHDAWTIVLNGLLLFVVLFYVYPLNFLFTLWLGRAAGEGYKLTEPQVRLLFTIYGLGFAAVFGVFGLLYLHAWRKRAVLDLNEIERFDTRSTIVKDLLYVLVGGTSIVIANVVPINWVAMAGWAYGLLGGVGFFHGLIHGTRRERLMLRLHAASREERPSDGGGSSTGGQDGDDQTNHQNHFRRESGVD